MIDTATCTVSGLEIKVGNQPERVAITPGRPPRLVTNNGADSVWMIDTGPVIGAQILGEIASELIHIGQSAIHHRDTIEYFLDTTFNVPTARCDHNPGGPPPVVTGSLRR